MLLELIAKPEPVGTIRRVESRNVMAESAELKNLKELRLVYPCWQAAAIQINRAMGRPRKWKADLYSLALALLPAIAAVTGTLALQEDGGHAIFIAFIIYSVITVVICAIRLPFNCYAGSKTSEKGIIVGFIFLVMLGLCNALTSAFPPYWLLAATLVISICIVLISQLVLALPKEYEQLAYSNHFIYAG